MAKANMISNNHKVKHLIYLSRRSIRELDFLMLFAEQSLTNFSEDELHLYNELLCLDDHILLEHILNPSKNKNILLIPVLDRIRTFLDKCR